MYWLRGAGEEWGAYTIGRLLLYIVVCPREGTEGTTLAGWVVPEDDDDVAEEFLSCFLALEDFEEDFEAGSRSWVELVGSLSPEPEELEEGTWG